MWAFDVEKGLTRGDAIGLLSALLLVGLTSPQFGKSYLLIPVHFESELQCEQRVCADILLLLRGWLTPVRVGDVL